MKLTSFFTYAIALTLSASALAHDYQAGDVHVDHPYARATVSGQSSGAAYLTIENKGKNPDKLIGAASATAKAVQIHTMSMDGNVMRMREVQELPLQPAEKIAMRPGDGYHVMLIGLTRQLKKGDKFPLTLRFEKAGKIDVMVWVEEVPASASHAH